MGSFVAAGLLHSTSVDHPTLMSTVVQGPAQIGRYEILGLLGEGGWDACIAPGIRSSLESSR